MEQNHSQSLPLTLGGMPDWPLRSRRPSYIYSEAEHTLKQAVARVLGREDVEYLRARPVATSDLNRHMRGRRKAFLKTYLRQMRTDFKRNSLMLRQFAADTDAPDLAFVALRQSVRFHALWFVLRTSLFCNLTGPAWRLADSLINQVQAPDYGQVSSRVQPAA